MKPDKVLADWTPKVRQVPAVITEDTCRDCLGPTGSGYHTCYVCEFMWRVHPEYHSACDLIVPVTVAVQPSDWYTAVRHYKSGAVNFRNFAPALAVVLREWLGNHAGTIIAAVGSPDLAIVVPSRHTSPPTPLYRVASWAIKGTQALASIDTPENVVRFVGPAPPAKHKRLYPDALEADPAVDGQHVLLVEDTWVSGSTALSTAIAIRRAGAAGIALVSIARMTYDDGMTPRYEEAAVAPIDYTHWPR